MHCKKNKNQKDIFQDDGKDTNNCSDLQEALKSIRSGN
jgi:hypothetical protein